MNYYKVLHQKYIVFIDPVMSSLIVSNPLLSATTEVSTASTAATTAAATRGRTGRTAHGT